MTRLARLWRYCRHHGLMAAVHALFGLYGNRFPASQGYQEALGTIVVTNMPSLRMSIHKGNEPLFYVSCFRLLFYKRLRVSKDIPERFWAGLKHA